MLTLHCQQYGVNGLKFTSRIFCIHVWVELKTVGVIGKEKSQWNFFCQLWEASHRLTASQRRRPLKLCVQDFWREFRLPFTFSDKSWSPIYKLRFGRWIKIKLLNPKVLLFHCWFRPCLCGRKCNNYVKLPSLTWAPHFTAVDPELKVNTSHFRDGGARNRSEAGAKRTSFGVEWLQAPLWKGRQIWGGEHHIA